MNAYVHKQTVILGVFPCPALKSWGSLRRGLVTGVRAVFVIDSEGLTKNSKAQHTETRTRFYEGSYGVLTGNTCIVGPRVASLVSRSRCTRSVYSRDFLDSPFEGVPFFRRTISRGFFDILETDVAGTLAPSLSCHPLPMLCCCYAET